MADQHDVEREATHDWLDAREHLAADERPTQAEYEESERWDGGDAARIRALQREIKRLDENHDQVVRWLREAKVKLDRVEGALQSAVVTARATDASMDGIVSELLERVNRDA